MLDYLRIQDLALIEDVALDFDPGVNVLTGETGAGKSFILKAIDFITGERLGPSLVRPGREKASAEAVFSLPDGEEMFIRRELAADTGRSRLFINDRLSSQESLRELRPALILHTSQQGQQRLLLPSYQNELLDDFMYRPDLLGKRAAILRSLGDLAMRRAALEERRGDLAGKRELLEFQQQEIRKIRPLPGEEEELEERRLNLRLAEASNAAVEQGLTALHGSGGEGGILFCLGSLERAVAQISAREEGFTQDLEALREMSASLADLSSRLRKAAKSSSPRGESESIEARLFALSSLKRKLKRTLPEILALDSEIAENLSFLDSCALDLKQLGREEDALSDELASLLAELNPARREAAARLKLALEAELRDLGFSGAVEVEFAFTPRELFPGRADSAEEQVRVLWKPNPGQAAQALDKIASGGELSRFLLALVALLSRRTAHKPALIFDEVDSGVGGITLNKVADKLRRLGSERQIILITHWPSLAAVAGRHFQVRKDVRDGETYTSCRRLSGQDVFEELARMGGGGEQGRALAKELLAGKNSMTL
ncbi:MAG: AAA family ATPase [Deltaproteobacteria bacterium]|jgi:DNA repair protein RecN (Recombination protein N)|nr:AAA family ATPase [Deltaproteobacteria bacterium]